MTDAVKLLTDEETDKLRASAAEIRRNPLCSEYMEIGVEIFQRIVATIDALKATPTQSDVEAAREWVTRVFRMQPETGSAATGLIGIEARWIAREVAALIREQKREAREEAAQEADAVHEATVDFGTLDQIKRARYDGMAEAADKIARAIRALNTEPTP